LTQRSTGSLRSVENLTGADIVAFLLRESDRLSVGSVKGRVAELRSLLKFLYLHGLTPRPLATVVPLWVTSTGVPGRSSCGARHLARRVCRCRSMSDRRCQPGGMGRIGALAVSLATEMLRRGATIVEVSQVLRHRDLATTAAEALSMFSSCRAGKPACVIPAGLTTATVVWRCRCRRRRGHARNHRGPQAAVQPVARWDRRIR
jgi:hypothetical protein